MSQIENLIICSPFVEPTKHWLFNRERKKFEMIPGRRPAGFLIATPASKDSDDPGIFREIQLVNKIRPRVDDWRANGYPNVTGVTKQLLEFWNDKSKRQNPFFFCQLEAIETLIWFIEAHESEKQGIEIPSDGGLFQRLLCKMATGSGKTIVMAMLISWQVINKSTYPQDTRFSKRILIMAPGLTVRSRLEVLFPSDDDNIYDEFNIVPDSFIEHLNTSVMRLHNWHKLMPEEDAKNSVVKLGEESDIVFSKRILDHDLKNIIVINDEAHHAYRADVTNTKGLSKSDLERDKRWIEGLDKIHRTRNIINCFDFSATPFPPGKEVSEDSLFSWIVSDFSLSDAIESGLTKTPRISIRDDSNKFDKDYRSRFYHLYKDDEVKPDLNRRAKPHEDLPDLVTNAYWLLGQDWIETKRKWDESGSKIPPVMITVCNRTETAARIKHSFENERFEGLKELSKPDTLLHIDSTTMQKAEAGIGDTDGNNLRDIVDSVGKKGKPGEQIRNIVAVQMLSEGWDARNVTHIMGLRAFSSQLLCEQVVGRGLRRTSYDVDPETGFYTPEYVNVFGIPFTFLPHEGGDGTPPPPTKSTTIIEPDPDKIEHEISWPNIERIDIDFKPELSVDWETIPPLELRSDNTATAVDMSPVLEGKPHVDKLSGIDLNELNKTVRLQTIVFKTTKKVYDSLKPNWKGNKEFLLMQIIKLVGEFIDSDKIKVVDVTDDELRKKMTILFSMQKVVAHVCKAIDSSNIENRKMILDSKKPIKSTGHMRTWSTKKPTELVVKSHINLAVYDSGWEINSGQELERNKHVVSWVRNDHIGFVIKYLYNGILHDYYPDFLIRLDNDVTLVLEVKGVDDNQNKEKRRYLEQWVDVVNENGNHGTWSWDVIFNPSELRNVIEKHSIQKITAKIRRA
ncbi:DEAD/DEAH box helicase family protein [Nitrosopumilus sp.]|nr:DEAD/DEAH box helicase family protein [Nitrosopumilus sp.]